MLNYDTLLSNYDDKLTLMQWLKKVEDALKDASAVSFDVVNLGNATFKFKIVFEDGSEIESEPLVVNQGDSVASAAIVNGDLILTLTNGDTIDAGNMFDGNVNITGTLDVGNDVSINGDVTASGDVEANKITQSVPNWSASFNFVASTGLEITNIYNRCEVINNVLYLIANVKVKNISGAPRKIGGGWGDVGYIGVQLPTAIGSKVIDIEGNPVTAAATQRALITSVPVVCCESAISSNSLVTHEGFRFDFANQNSANYCAMYLENYPLLEIPTDGELYIMGRIALTLI